MAACIKGETNEKPDSCVTGSVTRQWKPWTLSESGLNFLKNYEQLSLSMYNDSANHATIGYGHLIHHGPISGASSESSFKNGISESSASELLRSDLSPRETLVNERVKVPLHQHEYDALVIFCFNIGNGGFSGSNALKVLNAGQHEAVPDEIMKWDKAGGKKSKGLVNRRTEEVEIFRDAEYKRTR